MSGENWNSRSSSQPPTPPDPPPKPSGDHASGCECRNCVRAENARLREEVERLLNSYELCDEQRVEAVKERNELRNRLHNANITIDQVEQRRRVVEVERDQIAQERDQWTRTVVQEKQQPDDLQRLVDKVNGDSEVFELQFLPNQIYWWHKSAKTELTLDELRELIRDGEQEQPPEAFVKTCREMWSTMLDEDIVTEWETESGKIWRAAKQEGGEP